MWKDGEAIPLPVEDAEELMGFRRGYTANLRPAGNESQKTARRHALGNTFHVPSIVVLISLLMYVAPARADPIQEGTVPRPGIGAEHTGGARGRAWEREHAQGTMWDARDPEWNTSQKASTLLEEALTLLPPWLWQHPTMPEGAVHRARAALDKIDIGALRSYERYLRDIGAPATATGPDVQALWAKSPLHAAAGRQHRPWSAAVALPSLVPADIGPDAHIQAALEVQHPFAGDPPRWSGACSSGSQHMLS